MVQSICPRCGKQTDGEMIDEELYILVVCERCEVILGVLPKFYQKATWKSGKPRAAEDELEEAVPAAPAAAGKAEPGAATVRALEKKKRDEDRRLRWS